MNCKDKAAKNLSSVVETKTKSKGRRKMKAKIPNSAANDKDKVISILKKNLSEKIIALILETRTVLQDGETPDVPEYHCATCGKHRDGMCYREHDHVYKVNPFVNKCFLHTSYGAKVLRFSEKKEQKDVS